MGARRSIRARIAIFSSVVIALALFLFGLIVYFLASYGGARDRDAALRDRAEAAAASLATLPAADLAPGRLLAPLEIERGEIFVVVTDAAGATIVSTGEIAGTPPVLPPDLLREASAGDQTATVALAPGLDVRLYLLPWNRPDLGVSGWVAAGQTTDRLRDDLNGILVFMLVAAIVTLGAAFGANWRAAGRALRPLRAMATTADQIGETEDLSRRLPPSPSQDEIGRLTASFNGMLARLEEAHGRLKAALDREQRFVADASHELRTPLTSIRTNADFLLNHPEAAATDRQAAIADVAAEGERMGRIVQDLLTLARADAGQHLERARVDLRLLLAEIQGQARRLHLTREIALVLEPDLEHVTVEGDADALRRLLWILIDNALKHGGPRARVWLCLGLGGDQAVLRVADDGVGLPPDDLERIFTRFYQADPARSGGGAGLGLAIARWIVAEHGGTIRALNNDGPGASIFVTLPRAAG